MVKRQMDRFGREHWGQMAKVDHTWRATGNRAKLQAAWCRQYGQARAATCTCRLPQRPLKGRWGSKAQTEKFLLQAGREELPSVWLEAFATSSGQRQRPQPPVQEEAEDEDDPEHHRQKLSRWVAEATAAVCDAVFLVRLELGNKCGAPADHLLLWLQKHASHCGNKGGVIRELVTEKADSFFWSGKDFCNNQGCGPMRFPS